MKLPKLKDVFSLAKWTDAAFVEKSMPTTYYEETGGVYNYSPTDPGFSIVEPSKWRSLLYGPYAPSNLVELFHCVPEIFAPIHEIASRIANADFQLRHTYDDEVIYNNKKWNALFNQSNPLQHFRQFIYEAVVYEYVTGNSFMYFNSPSAIGDQYLNIAAMWNLPADLVKIVTNERIKLYSATTLEDIVTKYEIDDDNEYLPKDVLHIRSINLRWADRKLKGVANLLSADKAIINLIAVYEARNVIYTKRGALGFIVSKKTDEGGTVSLTPEEKRSVLSQHQSNYGITRGRHPIGVSDAPIDYVKVGASISELEPFTETLADACAIYGVLQVPDNLIPGAAHKTYENFAQADRALYNNVVIPKANIYMQSLTKKMGFDLVKMHLHANFKDVDSLQENKKEKAEVDFKNGLTYEQRFLNGVIVLNDWVVETGYTRQTNPLYDKRIYDMDDTELQKVIAIINIKKQLVNGTGNQNTGTTGTGTQAGGLQAV